MPVSDTESKISRNTRLCVPGVSICVSLVCVDDSRQPRMMHDGISEGRGIIEKLKVMSFYNKHLT